MRVLLTGAAGFVGSTIADALIARGDEVVGLDNLLPAAHGGEPPQWAPDQLIIGDVRDADTVAEALQGIDVVCHQASMVGLGVDVFDLPEYMSHNAYGTAVLLSEMARAGVRRLVQASSMVVYGEGRYECVNHGIVRPAARRPEHLAAGLFDPPCPHCGSFLQWQLISESAELDPRNAYATSKSAQESLAGAWARQINAVAISLRYHNIYGPRMPRNSPYAGVAAIFRSQLAAGRAPQVFEDGAQMRDFVDVQDVAAANLQAIDHTVDSSQNGAGEVLAFNISSGVPRSVLEFAQVLSAAVGGLEPIVVGGGRAGDVRHIVADPALARTSLGFRARQDFAEGVAEFATAPMREPARGQVPQA